MNILLLLLAMLATPAQVQSGWAKEYRAGLFERVYAVRVRQGLLEPGWQGGFASTPYCTNIGRIIHARFQSPVTGQYSASQELLTVDCSRPGADQRRHLREGLVVETDWQTACSTGWCRDGKARARVWWAGEVWR